MKFHRQLFSWICIPLCGCVALPSIPSNECGNGVVEAGEDCDGYAPGHQLCREPNAVEGACRWDCSSTSLAKNGLAAPSCPEGTHCGRDAICRSGLGTYEPWIDKPIPKQAAAVRVGDLDGDGLSDLLTLDNPNPLWQSIPNVLFFDENGGEAAPTYNPQTRVSSPVFAPIFPGAGRERQQIIAGTGFGVAVLESNANREVSARAYPFQTIPPGSQYRLVRVRGVSNTPLHEEVLIYLSTNGQSVLSAAATETRLGTLTRSVDDLCGVPTAGNFDDAPNSPCDELVLTYRESESLEGIWFCGARGELREFSEPPRVLAWLPTGNRPKSGALLADIDGDAHLDVVVSNQHGCPYAAFGLGDGRFAASLEYPTLTLGQLWPVTTPSGSCPTPPKDPDAEYPLAIGDLNADGKAEWVFSNGIVWGATLSPNLEGQRIELDGQAPAAAPYKKWTVARIADLTGDEYPDLVAGSSKAPDLDFLIGTGHDRLNPGTIETDGPVSDIVTGDYDGNLINDVAFIQAHAITSTDLSAPMNGLAIAYGRSASLPTAISELARFNHVEQLVSANYEAVDATEEIGVLAKATGSTATQLTMFVGNLGRHPISSLGLWRVDADAADAGLSLEMSTVGGPPLASTVGHFLDPKKFGMLALALEECHESPCKLKFRLWYAPDASVGDLAAPSDPIALEEFRPFIPATEDEAGELAVHFVVGHLDAEDAATGAPLDDVLMLTAGPDDSQLRLWRVTLPLTEDPLTLKSSAKGRLKATSSPLLADLDGDQLEDLAFLVSDPNQAQSSSTEAAMKLAIVWNDAGQFDLAAADYVDLDGTSVHGIAKRPLKSAVSLFVATDNGVYTIEWTERRQPRFDAVKFSNGIGLPGGNALAVGDMTGHGLADIALAGPGGISIFRELEDKKGYERKP